MVDLFLTIILIFLRKAKNKTAGPAWYVKSFPWSRLSQTLALDQSAREDSLSYCKKSCSHRIVFSHINAGSVTSLSTNGAFVPLIRGTKAPFVEREVTLPAFMLNRCTVSLKVLACQLICLYRRCQACNGRHIQFGRQGSGFYHCWWGMDKLRYFLKLLCEMCKRFLYLNDRNSGND